MRKYLFIRIWLGMCLIWVSVGWAGTTGKIVGMATDKSTGDPLPGTNILLQGTSNGAMAMTDGSYMILHVEPGAYQLVVSMMGYQRTIIKNVRVSTDLTTRIDIQMTQEVMQGDTTVVVCKRQLIRKDMTAWESRIRGSEISELPVQDIKDVIALQAGVTKDAAGELHIRGGRSGEVAFLIDGIELTDPLQGGFGSELSDQSRSRKSAGSNLNLTLGDDAINELTLISGTFNAEYGNAMSGLINVVTKSPGNRMTGKVGFTSDYVNDSPYRQSNALVQDKNPILENDERLIYEAPEENFQGFDVDVETPGKWEWMLNGPVPGILGLGFFVSGSYSNEDSYLPHGFDLTRNYFGKAIYQSIRNVKLIYTYNENRRISQVYSHSWKYLPENQGLNELRSRQHILTVDHRLSSRMFYTLKLAYGDRSNEFGIWDWEKRRFSDPETEYRKADRDNELEFYLRGTDDLYILSKSKSFLTRGDATYQRGMHHGLKIGFEIKSRDLSTYKRIEPWPDENGANRTIEFDYQPFETALYFQDRIEFDFLTVNAGLRFDYVDVHADSWQDIGDPLSPLTDAPTRSQLSPRLGFAFPISEQMVFHFSYGHFFQMPNYSDIYANLVYQDPDRLSEEAIVIIGNPGIKPQKTVSIESGLKYQLDRNSYIKMTAYHKDLTDLVGTQFYRRQLIYRYSIYTNIDYGNVKGIDFSWGTSVGKAIQTSLNYSYSVATGNSSFPTDQAYNAYYEQSEAQQEYPLDFDQRHTISASAALSYPIGSNSPGWKKALFSNLSVNIVAQYASGYPYTPITDDPTLFIEPNSARMPWTGTVDLRVQKRIPIGVGAARNLTIFTEISNLFDRQNALRVQSRTGKLWDTGRLELLSTGEDYVHDPSDAGAPRLIRIGAGLSF
ncbi:MAG: hypothetical protein B6244_10500 [Candidatus Cloacimonetes bacterium 4572_55]|nr:MAG: hypothetical protein B6244_10500 [Candidatus Cloacimonetes bacterium 4572_55]